LADEGPIVLRLGALQLDEVSGSGLTPRPFFMPEDGWSAAACPRSVRFLGLKAASR
jgi:hypothetical protein